MNGSDVLCMIVFLIASVLFVVLFIWFLTVLFDFFVKMWWGQTEIVLNTPVPPADPPWSPVPPAPPLTL
jgi:membrane glycosyltransferase